MIRPATVADAVALAEAGLPVFPCTMQKGPMTANGFKDAVLAPGNPKPYPYKRGENRVEFGPWPGGETLIGVPTGALSGLVVIDVDTYKAAEAEGDDATAAWLDKRRDLLNTARIHRTGSGGYHYVFRPPGTDRALLNVTSVADDEPRYVYGQAGYPDDMPRIKSRAGIKVGGETLSYVDVRADGGYVIWWAAHGMEVTAPASLAGPRDDADGLTHLGIPVLPPELLADLLESCRETSVAPSSDAAKRDEFVAMFTAAGLYRREKSPGVHCVTCPWIQEHPGGKQHADDTAVYFEPFYNGRAHSAYVCKDAACDGKRSLAQLRRALADGVDTPGNELVDLSENDDSVQEPERPDDGDRRVPVVAGASETDAWIARVESASRRLSSEPQEAAATLRSLLSDWSAHLMRNADGNVITTPKNVLVAMGYSPQTFGAFVYDEFLGAVHVTRDIPHLPHVTAPFEWQDDLHWMAVASWLNRHGLKPGKDIVCDAVRALADGRRMNSAREYFEGLSWDGEPRLAGWLARYLGATGSADYLSRVGAWFLMGVAARACQPGAKQDYTLVLVMKQGVGKTTVAEALAVKPHWFTDRVSALGSKDSLMELRGRLVVEMAELEVFRKSEVETQKAFLTSTVDKYRAPYGRSILSYPRTCCFIGTTNEETFLHDLTGNRRFWPVKCGEDIDVRALRRDLDQLYAEAFHHWRGGERYWPSREDNPIMEGEQEAYRVVSPLEEMLAGFVLTSPPREEFTSDEAYGHLNAHDSKVRGLMSKQVMALLRKWGYSSRVVRRGKDGRPTVWRRDW